MSRRHAALTNLVLMFLGTLCFLFGSIDPAFFLVSLVFTTISIVGSVRMLMTRNK